MRPNRSWDPTAYARFRDERSRAFHDLVARVAVDSPGLVVDLGCGNGPTTLALAERWPDARVVGVDSSETMLEAAHEADPHGRVEWVHGDLRQWDIGSLGAAPDVVVTSSTLQWVPRHLALVGLWVEALAPDGWFAMQVPGNYDSPSHQLMREAAAGHARAPELADALEVPEVGEPSTYLRLLGRMACEVDVWETTYLHVLDPEETDPDPVLTWTRATGLRPVLDLLTEEAELDAFIEPYAAALREAYPRTPAGVLFPFRRIFAVAHRTAGEPGGEVPGGEVPGGEVPRGDAEA